MRAAAGSACADGTGAAGDGGEDVDAEDTGAVGPALAHPLSTNAAATTANRMAK
jgi:hypothetical protein